MALDVSAITGYVAQNENELIGKAVLGSKTAKLVGIQTGVKGSSTINLLTAAPVLQAGGCGWVASGSTTITQRTIESKLIKLNTVFCEKDLIGTFAEMKIKTGIGKESLPFVEQFIDQNVKAVAKENEMTIWQGEYGNTGATYQRFDGLIHILDGVSGSTVNATLTGSTLAAAPITAINEILAKIPAEILDRDDLVIFVGYEIFRKYVAALQAANLYHYTADFDGSMSMMIPGYNVKLEGVAGLNLTNKAYATYAANIRVGVDMEGDAESFAFWYSQDNQEYRLAMSYNLGVNVAFPDFVVTYLN